MTLLMCKFVDSEMEQDLMQENSVLFKPTIKKDESSKPISDIGKDSSSDKVSDFKTVHPVVEEVRTSEITSQDTDFEGDVCDTTTVSKKDLDKKRKSPEKPAIAMEEDKISPTKKAKAIVGEQGSPISFEQDDVDQAKYVNDKKSEAIGEELKDFTYKDDNTDPSNEITENKDNTLLITGSKNKIMTTADDVILHSIESVNENDVESEKVTPISTEDPVPSFIEVIGREHNSNATNLKEINEVVENNNLDTDVKLVTVKDLMDNGNPEDISENIPNSLNANDKKDASPKDSTRNDTLDQDNKMDEVEDKELKTDSDSSQTELNAGTEEVENMDDSQLLTDPAILEAIKLSEITASKELDGVEDSDEMEEESEEEEEEEPEEPWKPEDYKIYSSSKEFSTLRQPRKSFMKTFRKALASIRFNSTTEPSPHVGNDQKKGSEKDETVPSQVNFLLNVGLAPQAETVPAKNKEEERLRRLDKISKLSNKAKLRMGRRSLKRLEDRFRSNLIRTVQQNTEVSTLCKEMLILDLNPTKYLWGSALLRKRELSKKLKEWFKQAKLTEAEELKNPSEDNPSLPSKLLRFTSCDTSAAPRHSRLEWPIACCARLLLGIKIGKAGLDLKWQSTVDQADFSLLATRHYELQCCHASTPWEVPSEWKTIGNIKAMPLPMACTIRKFEAGHIYSFKIRAVKSKKDRSEWSEPVSIAL